MRSMIRLRAETSRPRVALWSSACLLGAAMVGGCSNESATPEGGLHEVKPEYREKVAAVAKLGVVARADSAGEVTFLDFYNVQDAPAAMVHLKEFPHLKKVNFSSNKSLSDADLEHLSAAKRLEELAIHGTDVTDAGLAHLAGLENLKMLNLNETMVGDAGLAHLAGLTTLKQLLLQKTKVTDAGLAHIATLKSLKVVWLSGSQVTADGAAKLRQLLPDTDVIYTEIEDTSGQPLLPASAFEDGDG